MAKQNDKKKYQIDIGDFPELQNAVMEYFILMTEIMNIDNLSLESITMNIESNKILVEGEIESVIEEEESSEEDSDSEWI